MHLSFVDMRGVQGRVSVGAAFLRVHEVKSCDNTKVAFVGCGHGNLDLIYQNLVGSDVDAVVVCGDFEACRNELDLDCLSGPKKYHVLKDYWKYYKGTAVAPILTIFIGGNHEASNHLWELYYGGWVAPNIYYLGYSGVVTIGDLRIAGISGIYNKNDYFKGHFERVPYSDSSIRCIYHTRECEVWKMQHITEDIDVFISHDWPKEITKYGDFDTLYQKHHRLGLKEQVDSGDFGSPAHWELIQQLKPKTWVSGHMHIKYHASYTHPGGAQTNFHALSKSMPGMSPLEFLSIIDFPDKKSGLLRYDEEWLGILRATHTLTFFNATAKVPRHYYREGTKTQQQVVRKRYAERGLEILPVEFPLDAPVSPITNLSGYTLPSEFTQNAQTVRFINELGLPFPGFGHEEIPKEEIPKEPVLEGPEEMVTLQCANCKTDWQLPKRAILVMEFKKYPIPTLCKGCKKK